MQFSCLFSHQTEEESENTGKFLSNIPPFVSPFHTHTQPHKDIKNDT